MSYLNRFPPQVKGLRCLDASERVTPSLILWVGWRRVGLKLRCFLPLLVNSFSTVLFHLMLADVAVMWLQLRRNPSCFVCSRNVFCLFGAERCPNQDLKWGLLTGWTSWDLVLVSQENTYGRLKEQGRPTRPLLNQSLKLTSVLLDEVIKIGLRRRLFSESDSTPSELSSWNPTYGLNASI